MVMEILLRKFLTGCYLFTFQFRTAFQPWSASSLI